MDTIECIKKRRSIRSYDDKQIPKNILEDIIDCARLAPSANNVQPWEFVVVTDKNKLIKLAAAATWGPFIKDGSACIVVCGDASNKHLLEDGSAATQNILLAAWAHGIGTCWVAGWQRDYNPEIKQILEIPDTKDIVAIIPLGYADNAPESHGKRELKDIIHWDRF